MRFLKWIWSWLTSSGTRRKNKSHPDLDPIDVETIAADLRLAEQAKRLGEAGLPAPDASTPSGPEAAVIQKVEKARQDYVDWAELRLNVLGQDILRRNVIKDVNAARQADREFERTASGLLADLESTLRSLGDSARNKKRELEEFRERYGITRDAHYPSGTGSFLRYAILLLLIVIEGLLNASFFSQGLDTGLIGGFVQAGVLAGTNVIVAFLFGKFPVRYIHHSNVGPRLFGFLTLAAALSVMAVMGLSIAHYRDSLIAEAADPAKEVLAVMLAHPFQLRDFFSWALFGISVAFGLASLVDGLFSDDPHPGYGKLARRANLAADDYEDELRTLRERLEQIKDEAVNSLDKTLQNAQAATVTLESVIGDKRSAKARLSTALREADYSLEALLRMFRTENELHRGTSPRPAYFDTLPDLRPIHEPDFGTGGDEALLSEQRDLVRALLDEVQDIRARIQAAFTRQFDRVAPLDIHFPNKEVQ